MILITPELLKSNMLLSKKVNIVEIGYICETRIAGVSKTATNISQLIIRGIPYIQAAIKVRYK